MLDYSNLKPYKYINHVLSLASRYDSILNNLNSVSAASCAIENGLHIRTILPLMKPASVKRAYFHGLSDEKFVPPACLSFDITDLVLKYSDIEGDTLVRFMHCFPALQKFYCDKGSSGVRYLLPQKVGKAIKHLKLSLVSLTVAANNIGFGHYEPPPFESLVDFEKLRSIETDAAFLLAPFPYGGQDEDDENLIPPQHRMVDVLPKALKRIILRDCEMEVLVQVRELIERKEECMPDLNYVSLALLGYDKEIADKLKVDCKTAGIKLDIHWS
jgi:hypothetical protein